MSLKNVSHFTKSVRIKIGRKLRRKIVCGAGGFIRGYFNCLPKNESRKGGFPNNTGITDEILKEGLFVRFNDNDERDEFINAVKQFGGDTALKNLGIKKTKPKRTTSVRFKLVSG